MTPRVVVASARSDDAMSRHGENCYTRRCRRTRPPVGPAIPCRCVDTSVEKCPSTVIPHREHVGVLRADLAVGVKTDLRRDGLAYLFSDLASTPGAIKRLTPALCRFPGQGPASTENTWIATGGAALPPREIAIGFTQAVLSRCPVPSCAFTILPALRAFCRSSAESLVKFDGPQPCVSLEDDQPRGPHSPTPEASPLFEWGARCGLAGPPVCRRAG